MSSAKIAPKPRKAKGRTMRNAIDEHKRYSDAGLLPIEFDTDGYPEELELLIEPIDLVAVNLYPFAETIARPDITEQHAIENIDIGGPSLVRAAAKNHDRVTIVVDPLDYGTILAEIDRCIPSKNFELLATILTKLFQRSFGQLLAFLNQRIGIFER